MYKIVIAACLLLLWLDMPVQANVMVTLTPASGQVNIGQTVGVAIDISGLDSSVALSSYDLSLGFDPALLHFDSAVFGDPVSGDQLDLAGLGVNFPSATEGAGLINLIQFSLDSSADLLNLQMDQFTLATNSRYFKLP
ncbi:MAG: cohesin domain-containing protein [Methylococcales bacterium]